MTPVNDSTVRLLFKMPPGGKREVWLYARSLDCSEALDSLKILLLPVMAPLPGDTALCASDTLRLSPGSWFKEYLWQDGSNDSFFVAREEGTYWVQLQAYCGYQMSDTVYVTKAGDGLFSQRSLFMCAGDSMLLRAAPAYKDYQWKDAGQMQVLEADRAMVYPLSDQTYFIRAKTATGCWVEDSIRIRVQPLPFVDLGRDTVICKGASLLLNGGDGFARYQWSHGSVQPRETVKEEGLYRLQVTDGHGCRNADTIRISLKTCDTRFYVPDAFTPNGDGHNDVFKPLVSGNLEHYSFSIYNRWGQLVFQSKDPQKGWKGPAKGGTEVFVWACTFQFRGDLPKTEKGTIVLIR